MEKTKTTAMIHPLVLKQAFSATIPGMTMKKVIGTIQRFQFSNEIERIKIPINQLRP